jgi:SAM-dependent methyltransferase
MNDAGPARLWGRADAYEAYVGRWSRLLARECLAWMAAPGGGRWLDVGCGIGAVSQTILASAAPAEVHGIDQSEPFIAHARAIITDDRAQFHVGDAMRLPFANGRFDAVVSGLVLNFLPDARTAVTEMARVTRPGGGVASYVWDYGGEMQMMRRFWDTAVELDPAAAAHDEGRRFGVAHPDRLRAVAEAAGLDAVEARPIDISTRFRNFYDYWTPFLGGVGPAPTYLATLSEERQAALRERIRGRLPAAPDGSITLMARAWAVRGVARDKAKPAVAG